MKLDLPLPRDWEQRAVEEGMLLQAPNKISGMLVTPIVPAKPDPEQWVERAFMYRARPEDGVPRNLALSLFTTDAGWAGLRLDGDLGSQARMVIYLAFLDYAVTVVAMCRLPAEFPGWRDEIRALIAGSLPNFTEDRIACLAHLLGGPPRATSDRRARHPIEGWQRSFAGGDLILRHRRDPRAGMIRVSAGLSPIRAAAELIAVPAPAEGSAAAEAEIEAIDAPQIEITDEGEYAVLSGARTRGGQRWLALVFGDLEYVRIEAVTSAPELTELRDEFRATVHELALATTLGLGARRWRRFYFEPPPGWIGIARPRSSLWISPETPRRHHVMRVFDARPPAEHDHVHGARMFETLPQEFFREPPKGPAIYYTADDHECRVYVHTAHLPNRREPIRALEGTIVTEPYVYPIRLEFEPALLESSMQIFERVVASFRPLPERRSTLDGGGGGVLDHWAE